MKPLKILMIINIMIWLIVSYQFGHYSGIEKTHNDYKKYLDKKIVCDMPKGSILLSRKEGNFLICRIADEATYNGLKERLEGAQIGETVKYDLHL